MALRDLKRRLDRLDAGGQVTIAAALEALWRRSEERAQAWRAAGNSGAPPPEPVPLMRPLRDGATRAERELWRKLAHGHARILYLNGTEEGLTRLRELYAMSDADLATAINQGAQQ